MPIDETKWNTAQVLAGGVLNRPAPKSERPADAKLMDVDEDNSSEESLRAGLEAGGLAASMYYGCWSIWKTDAGFCGELMQYRNVTDRLQSATLDEAVEKAEDWFAASYG